MSNPIESCGPGRIWSHRGRCVLDTKANRKKLQEWQGSWREHVQYSPEQLAQIEAGEHVEHPKIKPTKYKAQRPKKPMNAYMLYANENREAIKADYPGADVRQVARLAGQEWREMSEEEKEPWEQQAAELEEHYKNVELPKYHAFLANAEANGVPVIEVPVKKRASKKVSKAMPIVVTPPEEYEEEYEEPEEKYEEQLMPPVIQKAHPSLRQLSKQAPLPVKSLRSLAPSAAQKQASQAFAKVSNLPLAQPSGRVLRSGRVTGMQQLAPPVNRRNYYF